MFGRGGEGRLYPCRVVDLFKETKIKNLFFHVVIMVIVDSSQIGGFANVPVTNVRCDAWWYDRRPVSSARRT